MRLVKTLLSGILLLPLLAAGLSGARADTDETAHGLLPEVEAFRHWDSENSFPKEAVLFVGSSSINYWKTAHMFPDMPVINRGFGGSTTSDVLFFYNDLIGKYAPSKIVIYVGDNDVTAGKSVDVVTADLTELFTRIERDFPAAQIYFLSIKASIQRWALWPKMDAVNEKVRAVLGQMPHASYVDVSAPLLNAAGEPDPRYFAEDGLHLSDEGYLIWTERLMRALDVGN